MFNFLDQLRDPWSNITASTVGLAAVVLAIYGKAIGGDDIPQLARAVLFGVGLAILMTGFALTWSFAWDTADPAKKKLKRGAKAMAGLVNIVAGFLVAGVAVGAFVLNWNLDGDSSVRADFAKSFSEYVDALDDDNSDSLFAAQMAVFANCKVSSEKEDSITEGTEAADAVLIQEVCRQLLEARGEMERRSAVSILAELTQTTSQSSGTTGPPISTPEATQ